MGFLFDDHIKKSREYEEEHLREVFGETVVEMGFSSRVHTSESSDNKAIKHILKLLGVKGYNWHDDVLATPLEQLFGLLRTRGIFHRRINLTGKWWKYTIGPLLGFDKKGNIIVMEPSWFGYSYFYTDTDGVKRKVNEDTMKDLSSEAYYFNPSLPNRSLKPGDLIKFVLNALPKSSSYFLVLVSLAISLIGMFIPFINKQIFEDVIPDGIVADIIPLAILLIGVAAGSALFEVLRGKIILKIKDVLSIRLQDAFMARIFTLNVNFFKDHPSGEITSRITSIRKLCSFVNEAILGALLTLLFSVVYFVQIFFYAKLLLVPSVIILLLQVVLLLVYFFQQYEEEKKLVVCNSMLDGLEFNMFSGIKKIKLTGSEKRAYTRWLSVYKDMAVHVYNPPFMVKLIPSLLMFCQMGGTVVLYYFAVTSEVSLSDFIAFSVAYGVLAEAMSSMTEIVPELAEISPLLSISKPILEAEPEVNDNSQKVPYLSGKIEISDLSFRYDEGSPWVFRGLNLNVSPGEYVGVVGPSGCGKSTLLRLLLGFEIPQSGGIFYDSYDLHKTDLISLRRNIGCCLQNSNLFAGDIFSNITITSPESTMEDAWEAARLADIADEINEMPMKMHTIVNEDGDVFSGGQKQRLLIARALINKPQILLFDEATSALDNLSQKQVSDNIDQLECTRIVIAHRISTIRHCDRIIVLNKGRIEEEGTFDELMQKKGLFYDMSKRQI